MSRRVGHVLVTALFLSQTMAPVLAADSSQVNFKIFSPPGATPAEGSSAEASQTKGAESSSASPESMWSDGDSATQAAPGTTPAAPAIESQNAAAVTNDAGTSSPAASDNSTSGSAASSTSSEANSSGTAAATTASDSNSAGAAGASTASDSHGAGTAASSTASDSSSAGAATPSTASDVGSSNTGANAAAPDTATAGTELKEAAKTTETPSTDTATSTVGTDTPDAKDSKDKKDEKVLQGYIRVVPSGTKLPIIMDSAVDSDTSQEGDEFAARTSEDLTIDGATVVPAGSVIKGRIARINAPKHLNRSGSVGLKFDTITTPSNQQVSLQATLVARGGVVHARRGMKDIALDTGMVAAPMLLGAAIGAIAGGMSNSSSSSSSSSSTSGSTSSSSKIGLGGGLLIGVGIGTAIGVIVLCAKKGKRVDMRPGDELKIELAEDLRMPM